MGRQSLSLSLQGQRSREASCPDPPRASAHPRFMGVSRFPKGIFPERLGCTGEKVRKGCTGFEVREHSN